MINDWIVDLLSVFNRKNIGYCLLCMLFIWSEKIISVNYVWFCEVEVK